MRPDNLKTKVFLDSGDPGETKQALEMLGFLDGQTTNPSLIAKNSLLKEKSSNTKLTYDQVTQEYKKIVENIIEINPTGSLSVEVYADETTSGQEMFASAQEFNSWADGLFIKFPTSTEGLKAAVESVKSGLNINMTLCFSQSQAAAVYAATQGSTAGSVYVSPFIGRLDDKEINGMDLIVNVLKMYQTSDGHVEVLAASVRSYSHFKACINLGVDIVTCPLSILKSWAESGLSVDFPGFKYEAESFKSISYENFDLNKSWRDFDISHELTDAGIKKFSDDWNSLISV